MIYIFWTCRDPEEARAISQDLLKQKLIACANIIPHIESHYVWEGGVVSDSESKVILKSKKEHYPAIAAYICEHASYDVPEVSSISIDEANPDYLAWLENSVL